MDLSPSEHTTRLGYITCSGFLMLTEFKLSKYEADDGGM